MKNSRPYILIRGGGDLASGVALRLHHAGLNLLITERPQPLAVRRLVSFAEAVYRGNFTVEDVTACLVQDDRDAFEVIQNRQIPVLIDSDCQLLLPGSPFPPPLVVIDARMTKHRSDLGLEAVPFIIGLGPGFEGGQNCHAAIETNRGHFLGRVLWQGSPAADTGIPGTVAHHQTDRVLRAPADGPFCTLTQIGGIVQAGDSVAQVAGQLITAPFDGVLRGLLHDGLPVTKGLKVGDLDPRSDPRFAVLVSEKSLAIGGAVLEALLTRAEIRERLWS